MMTTVSIDEKLLRKAMSASGLKSKRATVEEAVNRVLETEPSTVEPEMVKMLVLSIGGEEW